MSQFQKNQIKRQSINDQLPLKLLNYLDYQQHLIKQSFTTKSRYILPKSQQKIFPIDDEFASAFTQLTLDEKVTYYSKQIKILKELLDFSGAQFDSESPQNNRDQEIRCKVLGKGLGVESQEISITVHWQNNTVEIPHKLGVYKAELQDYLIRESVGEQHPEIVLDAVRPNIIKFWKFSFETEDQYLKTLKLLNSVGDRAMKKRLHEDIRNFQQSRVMSKSTLRKRSQVEIPAKQPFLDTSKFSSQVFEINQTNNSMWQDKNKNKKVVNFQRESNIMLSQHREETSIIDALSTQFRAVSPPLDYQRPVPQNLFDTDQDWFLKLMSEGYICSELYDGIEPSIVLNSTTNFKTVYQKNNNKILQNTKEPRCFKVSAKIKCPKDLVLSALCETDKWALWNKAVEEASVKLRVQASNMLVCKMKMKQLNFKYRPREFVFMMHFFNKDNDWYLMITSVKDAYHPVVEQDVIRAKISRCLIRLRESNHITSFEMIIDIKQSGDLNVTQQIELTEKFLLGLFDLESFLKDRVFVEAKANKYFDLKWSSERNKNNRFTLGKNNDLDETESFTSNLCSEICSFYSAEGPEDYEDLDLGQFKNPPNITFVTEDRQYSFKKKRPDESKVGHAPPLQVNRMNSATTLPFEIPIHNNKILLDQSTKQKLEAYIRQKQENRIRKLEGNFDQMITSQRKSSTQKISSKTSLPLPPIIETYSRKLSQQKPNQQRLSSYLEMKQVPAPSDISKVLKPIPIITKQPSVQSISNRKSSFSNIRGSAHQSNIYTSQAHDYDILPQKKAVSKIEIDKYNPDDHIVQFWEPKVYPDSGLVILSDEYLEKWVSVEPINVKKIRPYKGDNWDHFLFRDLWTVTQMGELKCVNQQKLSAQSSAIKLVLKRFASNVMSGKGILNVSLPVQIFSELSCLELIARSLCFAPYFLEKAAVSDSPVERFKIANAFSLATSLLYIEMQKPFNPILGETYQGWIGGSPIYCQQISHHPPISAFYFVGKGYTISGRLQPTIDLSLNSGVGWNEGQFTIKFTNYPTFTIRTQSPPGQITGLAYGDRKLNFTGKSYSYDNTGLFCQFIFNPTKKGMLSFGKQQKQSDYMKGAILKVDPSFIRKYCSVPSKKRETPSVKDIIEKICDAEGRWTVGLSFAGVEYFNVMRDQPYMLEQEKYPLKSHCNYREDIHYRRCQNYELAQSHKERLEVLQRNDKKLRSKDGH